MLILSQDKTRQRSVLGTRTLIGRSLAADLHLSGEDISLEHATLWWDGQGWKIRDLASRNGTLVDGQRLSPGKTTPVGAGQKLTFGAHDSWAVDSADAPVPAARALMTNEWVQAEDELLVLPTQESPILTIYVDIDGHWQAEGPAEMNRVQDLQLVEAAGQVWRLYLPATTAGTVARVMRPTLEVMAFEFSVSRDEEHVELVATGMGERIDLKARAHNYALLLLARARLKDGEDTSLPPASHGWLYQDDLCKMLGVDDAKLNLFVFRARKQVAASGIEGSAGIVERRVSTRQLRLGVADVTIKHI